MWTQLRQIKVRRVTSRNRQKPETCISMYQDMPIHIDRKMYIWFPLSDYKNGLKLKTLFKPANDVACKSYTHLVSFCRGWQI